MNLDRINTLLQKPHARAILVGVLVLAILAVLQVGHLNSQAPMCELIEDCKLNRTDLERMQFALGKAGLSEFSVENGQLMVPQRKHGDYLQAIAENDAIPQRLRTETPAQPSINPFMSRTQQLLISENEKKREIREMVTRLPFVEQAWFEMDTAQGGSAFKPARQSAVISVQPPTGFLLDSSQVATLRQMIGGAIAGINPKDIVVIDVSAGYAHQNQGTPTQFKPVSIDQRPVHEQKSYYTNRIRQALASYGEEYANIDVDVQVEMIEVIRKIQNPIVERAPAKTVVRPASATMGTNGVASIYNSVKTREPEQKPVAQVIPVAEYDSRVLVSLEIPQSLVSGLPNSVVNMSTQIDSSQTPTVQAKFERLAQELVSRVRPILPNSSFQRNFPFPISINLVREPVIATATIGDQVKAFMTRHWPSLAVLGIGLVLLSIMTRTPEPIDELAHEEESQDIVSINSVTTQTVEQPQPEQRPDAALAEPEDYAKRDAERKLNRLFEKDPDSAAKVIESWIRDAA